MIFRFSVTVVFIQSKLKTEMRMAEKRKEADYKHAWM